MTRPSQVLVFSPCGMFLFLLLTCHDSLLSNAWYFLERGMHAQAAFETELRLFEEGLAEEANTVLNEATSIITGTSNSRD
ncbi:unnamed protein product [Ectocarpus sp. 4 AP-2014]